MDSGNLIGILKFPICFFKGHDIDVSESIVSDVMIDKRNWLCKCHRCGLYEMRDGAISGISVTVTEREAFKTRDEFYKEFSYVKELINP